MTMEDPITNFKLIFYGIIFLGIIASILFIGGTNKMSIYINTIVNRGLYIEDKLNNIYDIITQRTKSENIKSLYIRGERILNRNV